MKLHIISIGSRKEYNITNSYAHEEEIAEYVREKENKYVRVSYDIENIEPHHLINLFSQLDEDDIGFRNACDKLHRIITNKTTTTVADLFEEYNKSTRGCSSGKYRASVPSAKNNNRICEG